MIPNQEKLKSIWYDYTRGGKQYQDVLRPVIRESWDRCRKAGVDFSQARSPEVVDAGEIQVRIKNNPWVDIARSVMETLHHFVEGSGFFVTVCDKDGYILDLTGDEKIVGEAIRGNWVIGANWRENIVGTNAMGTALITGRPLQVFGSEHYIKSAHRWTCSAAPIENPDGEVVGVLCMSGLIANVHLHTLGMVVAGADAIERQMAVEKAWQDRDKANRVRDAIMESISEGLLAIDRYRKVIHINAKACWLLDINSEYCLGHVVDDIFPDMAKILPKNPAMAEFLTDHEMDISTSLRKTKLTVTSRPIYGEQNGGTGVVLVINEHTRARKLAQKFSGAVAVVRFEDLIGEAPEFRENIRIARLAAATDANVLLLGESGTGKDMLAQAIHNAGDRSNGPFVAINCGAIPRDLIASELFGYTEGAFTGARRGGQPGKFELAEGGTLFLDEIGEMPVELQVALLRVIEQRVIVRVGGLAVVPVNVRIIAATHKDLLKEIEKKRFRQDLYYRLNVVTINIASLRRRKGDIMILLRHFLDKMGRQMGKTDISVQEKAQEVIARYTWPGNVRELQNIIERSLYLMDGNTLQVSHLPREISSGPDIPIPTNMEAVADFEKEMISRTIDACNGNITKAAKMLGMGRTTIYRKMNRYGLHRN